MEIDHISDDFHAERAWLPENYQCANCGETYRDDGKTYYYKSRSPYGGNSLVDDFFPREFDRQNKLNYCYDCHMFKYKYDYYPPRTILGKIVRFLGG